MDAFAILYGLNVAFAVQEKKAISEITTEKQRNNSNLKKDNPIYCHIKNENRTKDHKKHKKHIIQQPNKPNNAQHVRYVACKRQ